MAVMGMSTRSVTHTTSIFHLPLPTTTHTLNNHSLNPPPPQTFPNHKN
ncbi:hypothetical protein M7I_1682 [Glarea lozoyensis 74030]|uniref:Uncharacterized protein n=1 Tax=Glarea lozoyensis (strain ATCC 74030 / MF5533) TaxID=1104152 RepID=H0EGR3_GLAL7|nr:hypothetical protein M7I_1682 [Glarea lozoyensis 74030]